MKSLKTLSDKELLNRVSKLVKQEHNLTLEILLHSACAGHATISCVSGDRSRKPKDLSLSRLQLDVCVLHRRPGLLGVIRQPADLRRQGNPQMSQGV